MSADVIGAAVMVAKRCAKAVKPVRAVVHEKMGSHVSLRADG